MPAEARVPAELRIGAGRGAPRQPCSRPWPASPTRSSAASSRTPACSRRDRDSAISGSEIGAIETEITNQQSGCGLIMTEFTSADGLSRMRETKRKRYLTYYDDEHPISAQLFGSNPETLAESARIVAGRRLRHRRPEPRLPRQARRRLQRRLRPAARPAADRRDLRGGPRRRHDSLHRQVPHGLERRQHRLRRAGALAEDSGLNAVALHARTRETATPARPAGSTSPPSKDAVTIPVIGNGDIRTPEDAAAMVDATGCDAVMIGRAAPANPWIFRQIAQYTADRLATTSPPMRTATA